MIETDKIVAAILTAAAYSKQERVEPATLAGTYRQFLELVQSSAEDNDLPLVDQIAENMAVAAGVTDSSPTAS